MSTIPTKGLIGETIVDVRPMTKKEQAEEGWDRPAAVLVLSNGTRVYALADDEGNEPGCLATCDTSNQSHLVLVPLKLPRRKK